MFRSFLSLVYRGRGVISMVKKAVIEISLVKESAESANKKIMKEIFDGLSEDLPKIPWMKQVEKVEIVEI
jgi:hypothetical protein